MAGLVHAGVIRLMRLGRGWGSGWGHGCCLAHPPTHWTLGPDVVMCVLITLKYTYERVVRSCTRVIARSNLTDIDSQSSKENRKIKISHRATRWEKQRNIIIREPGEIKWIRKRNRWHRHAKATCDSISRMKSEVLVHVSSIRTLQPNNRGVAFSKSETLQDVPATDI